MTGNHNWIQVTTSLLSKLYTGKYVEVVANINDDTKVCQTVK